MKLILSFGLSGSKKQVNWWNTLESFPKLLQYNNKKWEWFMYNTISTGETELTFSEISPYHPRYNDIMEVYEIKFGNGSGDGCECGAIFTSFKFDHMRYCKLWTKW